MVGSEVLERSAEAREQALLAAIEELARELHPAAGRRPPASLDASLARDLGIDSLARLELLHRLERRLGVVLPEQAAMEVETPRDLLRVMGVAPGPALAGPSSGAGAPTTPGAVDEPVAARTLCEVLRWHAGRDPNRPFLHLLEEGTETRLLRLGELLEGAEKVAAGLRAADLLPGQSVALMLPSSVSFFTCFHGILLAGGVPVPVYPPYRPSQLEEHIRRQVGILRNAEARLLITIPQLTRVGPLLRSHLPLLREVLTEEDLLARGGGERAGLSPRGEDVALLQYTSGSTGDPKGVVLTHQNLLANIRAMGRAVEATPQDVFVSWLPLYHDMGLIGACLGTLYYGCELVLLSPLAFMARPVRWLQALSRFKGTLSAAPNFAYEVCASRLAEDELAGLDLSSWRIAFNGAEPVDPDTLERFAARLAPYGLRREALLPVYGLAESSVGLAFPPPGRGPRVDRVRRLALDGTGLAEPASAEDPTPLRFVSCGLPLPGHELRVVDGNGRELGERREGRVEFRGPSATGGYLRNPAASAALLRGEGWLDSGDLGYMAGGELFVTGRVKDLIKKGGRNIHPQELEGVVGQVPGVRAGCVAAFGVPDPAAGAERLVVVAETRETDPARLAELRQRVLGAVGDLLELAPDELLLLGPHAVPKTSSGKIRRAAAKDLFLRGELGRQRRPGWQLLRLVLSGTLPFLQRLLRGLGERLHAAWTWVVVAGLGALLWLDAALLPRAWRMSGARRIMRLASHLTRTPLRVQGLERLQGLGACVFVSNHASYIDSPVLTAALPGDLVFVGKQELLSNAYMRFLIRRLGQLTVERFDARQGSEQVEQVAREVRAGRRPIFFAEGTFVRATGLREFRLGAFVVAAETGAPIVPVTIRGTREVLRGDESFPRRGTIEVVIGEPIRPEGRGWNEVIRLRDRARAVILAEVREPDMAGESVLAPPGPAGA